MDTVVGACIPPYCGLLLCFTNDAYSMLTGENFLLKDNLKCLQIVQWKDFNKRQKYSSPLHVALMFFLRVDQSMDG